MVAQVHGRAPPAGLHECPASGRRFEREGRDHGHDRRGHARRSSTCGRLSCRASRSASVCSKGRPPKLSRRPRFERDFRSSGFTTRSSSPPTSSTRPDSHRDVATLSLQLTDWSAVGARISLIAPEFFDGRRDSLSAAVRCVLSRPRRAPLRKGRRHRRLAGRGSAAPRARRARAIR